MSLLLTFMICAAMWGPAAYRADVGAGQRAAVGEESWYYQDVVATASRVLTAVLPQDGN